MARSGGGKRIGAYIDLDIEILEIEGVLPDVDTNDRDQVQEGVLVSGGSNLQTLGDGIVSLKVKS